MARREYGGVLAAPVEVRPTQLDENNGWEEKRWRRDWIRPGSIGKVPFYLADLTG